MNVWPVITREMRAEARNPFTYTLRMIGVIALLATIAFYGVMGMFSYPGGGAFLFLALEAAFYLAIWLCVPMLTADCISRERRESTLGLLFLTPLKARDIVVAKSLAHGLRATTFLLAILPVFAIPFLMGGVGWPMALAAMLVNLLAISWALAAGLLASAFSKARSSALGWAAGLAFVMFIGFSSLAGQSFASAFTTPMRIAAYTRFYGGGMWALGINQRPTAWGVTTVSQLDPLLVATCATVVLLLLVLQLAAIGVRRGWQDNPPSPARLKLEKQFCTPVLWQGHLRRWLRRKLERNPIGWVEQRKWSGRLVTWTWLAVMVTLYSVMLRDPSFYTRGIESINVFTASLLAISIAATAANSFRVERESGLLELLLVSPLREDSILFGRIRGIWTQFLPSAALLLLAWLSLSRSLREFNDDGLMFFFLITFIVTPVVGLYFSLKRGGFISAFLSTLFYTLILPLTVTILVRWFGFALFRYMPAPTEMETTNRIAAGIQLFVATGFWLALRSVLIRRDFTMQPQ